jgi:hypothetical protein
MRILFDHNLPRKLRQHLSPHTVTLTKELGWDQFNNSVLLSLAQAEFDVFLTVDTLTLGINSYRSENAGSKGQV